MAGKKANKTVATLTHEEATRKNIPTAEYRSVMDEQDRSPIRVAYERRNRDLDPQLVWRGKDQQDWSDLVVNAPPLYIQEKVHPKALIDDLCRRSVDSEQWPVDRKGNSSHSSLTTQIKPSLICSAISTGCPRAPTTPTSTSTTATGRTV